VNLPNKDVTMIAYLAADNAGPISITARYYASEGTAQYGGETFAASKGGTFNWRPFTADLHMPDDIVKGDAPLVNPRALRLFFHHSPPRQGVGEAVYDDVAVINWEQMVPPGKPIATPNARDFVRVSAPPGHYVMKLVFRSYVPTIVARRAQKRA
jgi:hypothetical protein